MIDRIYKTLLFFSNNQLQGNVTPTEFGIALYNRMLEKFEGYFFELNQHLNRENRRLVTSGFPGVSDKLVEKISHFLTYETVDAVVPSSLSTYNGSTTEFDYKAVVIPDDMVYLDNMVPFGKSRPFDIAENNSHFNTVRRHPNTAPTEDYPLAIRAKNIYRIVPDTIEQVEIAYLRKPLKPNWTYTIPPGATTELFNPSDVNFQDVDMHVSEETDLTLMVLSSFGINLKEKDLIEYTERNEIQKEQKETNV